MWELTPLLFVVIVVIAGGTLVGPAVLLSPDALFHLEIVSLAKERIYLANYFAF